jgi:hypothetical protein
MDAGQKPSDYTILLGTSGGIRMIADSDQSLDSLRREFGAQRAYRITAGAGQVSVDGQEANRSCKFEGMSMAKVAQFMLNARPAWEYSLV